MHVLIPKLLITFHLSLILTYDLKDIDKINFGLYLATTEAQISFLKPACHTKHCAWHNIFIYLVNIPVSIYKVLGLCGVYIACMGKGNKCVQNIS
jgi:hypothetical protein